MQFCILDPSNGQARGSKRKHSSNAGYKRSSGCYFQTHEEGSIYVSKDKTSWTVISASHTTVGKFGAQNVLKETPGPTPYVKRNVGNNVSSAYEDGQCMFFIMCWI